jgi:hypothetical protein
MSSIHSRIQVARFEYQFLDKSLEAVAESCDIPTALIAEQAELHNWSAGRVEPVTLPTTNNEAELEEFKKAALARITTLSLYRQIEQQAAYNKLETLFLLKISEVLEKVDTEDASSSSRMKTLVSTLNALKAHEPVQVAKLLAESEAEGGTSFTVNIQNNV